MVAKTTRTVPKTSAKVMIIKDVPSFFMSLTTNSLPILKATIATAISAMMPKEERSWLERSFRHEGPRMIPAITKPKTLDNLRVFANLPAKHPTRTTIASLSNMSMHDTPLDPNIAYSVYPVKKTTWLPDVTKCLLRRAYSFMITDFPIAGIIVKLC
mgnify:CR=1 FL=1